ncbi:MAG: hypothetical protein WDZ52_13370 [Pseudohongiellaceae bacterium]
MPQLEYGGLFIPLCQSDTVERNLYSSFAFNAPVCLVLKLFDEPSRFFCITRVVWKTPGRQRAAPLQGLGLQFSRVDTPLKSLLETKLRVSELAD